MNTMDNITTAESYYKAMLAKDFDKMESYLDKNVEFISPLAKMHGKDEVLSSVKKLSQVLKDINIRSKFALNNQIMLAYDFIFPEPIGVLRSACLMEFTDKKISKIELFFDARPFMEK